MAAMARRRSWQWSLPGIVLVALLAAFLTLQPTVILISSTGWLMANTLLLASGERVRLIGADTPETKHPKQGYGHAYTQFPFSRMEEFRWLEREARERRWGQWRRE
jgi:endonuclease YncB( thermonuclease family)